jgi:hypothetical protein
MIPPRPTKLPSRKVMIDLGKSQQTLANYAKVTPSDPTVALSPVAQFLRKGK